jgi:hypothetical protein
MLERRIKMLFLLGFLSMLPKVDGSFCASPRSQKVLDDKVKILEDAVKMLEHTMSPMSLSLGSSSVRTRNKNGIKQPKHGQHVETKGLTQPQTTLKITNVHYFSKNQNLNCITILLDPI